MARLGSAEPRDMLMTPAPWLAAYRMPWPIASANRGLVLYRPSPGSWSSRMTRTESTRAAGATPMTPSARPGPLPCPAMSEAMKVPCRCGGW